MPPLKERSLKLYLSAGKESIGCIVAQNNVEGHKQVFYYLSRVLNSIETRYTPIEKLCLALYFACTKLRHYLIKYLSVCGLSNRLDEIHAKSTLNHCMNRKRAPCFVKVHLGLFST